MCSYVGFKKIRVMSCRDAACCVSTWSAGVPPAKKAAKETCRRDAGAPFACRGELLLFFSDRAIKKFF